MPTSNMTIKFETEPIVKLECRATDCAHNLESKGYDCCDLKYVVITQSAECLCYEEMELGNTVDE